MRKLFLLIYFWWLVNKQTIKKYMTPTMFVSFGLAWFCTNGYAYTLLGIGIWLNIKWMVVYGTAYLSILWLPVTPEKLITVPLAFFFQKILFGVKESKSWTYKEYLKSLKVNYLNNVNKLRNKQLGFN